MVVKADMLMITTSREGRVHFSLMDGISLLQDQQPRAGRLTVVFTHKLLSRLRGTGAVITAVADGGTG